jgi:hypothetical protein
MELSNYKIIYLLNAIAIEAQLKATKFGFDNWIKQQNYNLIGTSSIYIYNLLISECGGITHFKTKLGMNCLLELNQKLYDEFNKRENIIMIISKCELIDIHKNTLLILFNKGDKKEYYSLIFLAVPFALKISDKKKLIKEIETFIKKYTNDTNQIICTIICGLFIHYALNKVHIDVWIEKINEDLGDKKEAEKYIDLLNNYDENNFRKGKFIIKPIEEIVVERNKYFFKEYCERDDKLLAQRPEQQMILILDSLLRAGDNFEKLVLFGVCSWSDNIVVSIILGILYEIIYSSTKINKNLLKRFSFN